MKKIYLLAASLFFGTITFAQGALYDLEVILINPTEGAIVAPSNNQEIEFKIVNNGPDVIVAGSIMWITGMRDMGSQGDGYFTLDDGTEFSAFDAVENLVSGIVLPNDLAMDESITSSEISQMINQGQAFVFDTEPYAGEKVGIIVFGVGEDLQDIIFGLDPNDYNNSNNWKLFKVEGGNAGVELNKKNVNVYPNPTCDYVTIEIDGLNNGNVSVFSSVTGKKVLNTSISNNKQLDVSTLSNGVYIYNITNEKGELIKRNKLIIQK